MQHTCFRRVAWDPHKGTSNSHGARPVHLIITTIKWIRTSRLPIKKSLRGGGLVQGGCCGSRISALESWVSGLGSARH